MLETPVGPSRAKISVRNLSVEFRGKRGTVSAVADVSFDLFEGESLGLVGESGSGKSTIARAILGLVPASAGRVLFDDVDLTQLSSKTIRSYRPELQMIVQDSVGSMNPRRRARDIVAEGLRIWPDRASGPPGEQVDKTLADVGLDPSLVGDKRPREFSGGQCQRLSIARAVTLNPSVLVCDESVSALDVSVQAQILNLLRRTQRERRLTMLFISHDLGVVQNITDRVMVLYLGKVCEVGPTSLLFRNPVHPYTKLLIDSVPRMTSGVVRRGEIRQAVSLVSPVNPPSGCRFRTRCPLATDICASDAPELRKVAGRMVACHHAESSAEVGGVSC